MTTATPRRVGNKAQRARTGWFGAWLARPLASFHLVVAIAVLLTVLGLVMVLSASSVEAYAGGGSVYSLFIQQAMFAVLGGVLFYIALRVPMRVMRQLSFPMFALSLVLLVLVLIPGIGTEVQGSRRWFDLGLVSIQPSEIVKITLVVWGSHLLASRQTERAGYKDILMPLVPAGLLVCFLVVLEPNLSTTIALGIVLTSLLWFGGLPLRMFVTIAVSGGVAAGILALSAGYRSDRMRAFFSPGSDPQGIGYQARQAMYSLADGGIWGRGLGQSRAKWSYLPNAHNDFIFAIIGEELGFLGCALVLGLFALFVYAGLRIATRSVDPFIRLLTASATTWITGQALINVGYVVGLLPVTGLQLPLVSAGGSSLAITLLMFGIIANAARHEPEAVAALHGGGDGRFSRLLRLPKPEMYSPTRARAARARGKAKAKVKPSPPKRALPSGRARGGSDASARRSIDSDSARRSGRPADRSSRSTEAWRSTRAWEPNYPMKHARERGNSR
ncbi:putative lipid II flippase FtsW [Nocardia seriolae]|uniref:Probable peptidoglycan glycosyltransferase FtsW n=1 Tax=Nocardia seriolae TaxID=37332 RepID=A0A0B8NAB2_9NOCA|nr:putative lipid II flippase FtsW [Nocardia seriolae]APA97406.1 Putative lipid II flippase FtsW [Nocardia seriolae]MTJ62314.1 putative lipid II flippase FtsW [Nocardia seriolae]MTJ70763.1 putative lipid II flippase FtsW [Nocardia seriolae]MTJ87220.1 putative lipid II flippase FtsW [Nocardia seriolae]MTK31214.1 putative lipid II flippase FtsW [Nocardia seriolae]